MFWSSNMREEASFASAMVRLRRPTGLEYLPDFSVIGSIYVGWSKIPFLGDLDCLFRCGLLLVLRLETVVWLDEGCLNWVGKAQVGAIMPATICP